MEAKVGTLIGVFRWRSSEGNVLPSGYLFCYEEGRAKVKHGDLDDARNLRRWSRFEQQPEEVWKQME